MPNQYEGKPGRGLSGDVEMSFREIAKSLGVSQQRAHQIYQAAMLKLRDEPHAAKLRELRELAESKRLPEPNIYE